MKGFFGKHRGKIAGIIDPLGLGRIQVTVPSVLGEGRLAWAMPCVPYAGPGVGLFLIPPLGADVWVEFEGGDINHPIWTGCFWGTGEAPSKLPTTKMLKTDATSLTLDDLAGGGVELVVGPPALTTPVTVRIGPSGVEVILSPNSVKMTATDITLATSGGSVKVTAADVELSAGASSAKLSPDGIVLANGPSTAKVAPGGIDLANGASSANVGPSGVELGSGASKGKLTAANLELTCGAAAARLTAASAELACGGASVKLDPVTVNVNNGALQVI